MNKSQTTINRFKVKKGSKVLQQDTIAIEEPLQIRLVQGDFSEIFSITLRTPNHDQQLAYGLLFSEGIIDSASDIESFEIESLDDHFSANQLTVNLSPTVTLDLNNKTRRHPSYSGCGICGKTSLQALELKQTRQPKTIQTKLTTELIKSLRQILAKQPLFSSTGGSHVAGLIYEFDGRLNIEESPFFEDVGRHNALDKLIGHELHENNLFKGGVLVLSGRIGFELVQKAVIAGYSTIVALGAPSNLAIKAANQFKVTLIGFAKDESFNLYTNDDHLLE